jgi:hypothetical protein
MSEKGIGYTQVVVYKLAKNKLTYYLNVNWNRVLLLKIHCNANNSK